MDQFHQACCTTLILWLSSCWAACPSQSVVSPCTCLYDVIQCSDLPDIKVEDRTLERVFQRMSETLISDQKHFQALYVTGTSVTELRDNLFRDIVFDEIYITDNPLLTKVHSDAFNGTNRFTTKIDFISNDKLSQSADNSLYDALSKLVKVEQINLAQGNNVTQVPSYAFKPTAGHQDNLWLVSFQDSLEQLGSRAFYYLTSLRVVSFSHTRLKHIPAHAFQLETNSSTRLQINLNHNADLTGDSFDKDALTGTNRPTTVILDERITFLKEDVFRPFLNESPVNSISHANHKNVNCTDPRNAWLKSQWARVRLCEP